MPETRYALFVLGVGAGFFVAMYEWVTMIAEALPNSSVYGDELTVKSR